MENPYVVWSCKMQGWSSKVGNYTTDVKEARTFTRSEALSLCGRQKSENSYGLIPVSLSDLEAV